VILCVLRLQWLKELNEKMAEFEWEKFLGIIILVLIVMIIILVISQVLSLPEGKPPALSPLMSMRSYLLNT